MKDSIEKALNSENPVPPVAANPYANPYATHDMQWHGYGTGYCRMTLALIGLQFAVHFLKQVCGLVALG
jgi:hypothetical protein